MSDNYPGLTWIILRQQVTASGKLVFSAASDAEPLRDSYNVEIKFPNQYPDDFPRVWEKAGRIPKNYHKMENGSLCLGTPLEQMIVFRKDPRIVPFIDTLLVPYLYRYAYIERFHTDPYADRPHGVEGLVEHFGELLGTQNIGIISELLDVVPHLKVSSNSRCPCRSGKRLSQCHGPVLTALKRIGSRYLGIESEQIRMHINGLLADSRAKTADQQSTTFYLQNTKPLQDRAIEQKVKLILSDLQFRSPHVDGCLATRLKQLTSTLDQNKKTRNTK